VWRQRIVKETEGPRVFPIRPLCLHFSH
jgi:hypothetical protein